MVWSRSRSAALSSAIWASLAVSRARSAGDDAVVGAGRWRDVVGDGRQRPVRVDERHEFCTGVDAFAGPPLGEPRC